MEPITIEELKFEPRVGMSSLVGVSGTNYPIAFGNHCSIANGPHLCNMWAENLRRWSAIIPDSGPIAVTVYTHFGRSLGLVTDDRLVGWCNDTPCVTGIGWPSVAVMRLICDRMRVAHADVCGCEAEDQAPIISRQYSRHVHVTNICHRCRRRWPVQ